MPIHKTIRLRPMASVIGVLLLLLSITGLSADSPRTTESASSSLLLSHYSTVANDTAGDVLGSFVVRAPKWDVWAGGRRILRRTRDELGALPLRDYLTDHVMHDEAIGERGRQRAKNFVWGLARSAVDEGVLAATDELRRRHFIETINVDVDAGLGDRFAHIGVDALGALRESQQGAVAWQLRGFTGQKGRNGGNAGLIYRHAMSDAWLLGFNLFADVQTEDEDNFSRWSLGVESRSAWADLFANYYGQISDDIRRRRADNAEEAIWTASGYDVELNVHAPSHRWLTGVLGLYSWGGGDDYGRADVDGVRIGVKVSPNDTPFVWELSYDDNDKGEDIGGRISYRWRFGASSGGAVAVPSKFEPRDWFYAPVEREYTQRIFRQTLTPATRALNLRGYESFAINNLGSAEFSGRTAANEVTAVIVNNGNAAAMQAPVRDLFAAGGAVTLETRDNAVVVVSYESGVLRVGSTVVLDGLSVRLDEGSVSLQVNTGSFTVAAQNTDITVRVAPVAAQVPAVFRFTYVEGRTDNTIALVRGDFDVVRPDRTEDLRFACAAGETPVATIIERIAFGGGCVPEFINRNTQLKLVVNSPLAGAGTGASPYQVPRDNLNAGNAGIVLANAVGSDGGATTYRFSGTNADIAVNAATGEIRFARNVSAEQADARYTVTVTVMLTVDGLTFNEMQTVVFFVPAVPPVLDDITVRSELLINTGTRSGDGSPANPYKFARAGNFTKDLVKVIGGGGSGNFRYTKRQAVPDVLDVDASSGNIAFPGATDDSVKTGVHNILVRVTDTETNEFMEIRVYLELTVEAVTPPTTDDITVRTELLINTGSTSGDGSQTNPYKFARAGNFAKDLVKVIGGGGSGNFRYTKRQAVPDVLDVDASSGNIAFPSATDDSVKTGAHNILVRVTDTDTNEFMEIRVYLELTVATVTPPTPTPLSAMVEFDGDGDGNDASPYEVGGAAGSAGAVGAALATVRGVNGTPGYSYDKLGAGALMVDAGGVIRIETALAVSGKVTITVQVGDSATPTAGQTTTVVVFDVNVALQSAVEFLVAPFDPAAPATTPAAGAGTAADPFVFAGSSANLAAVLATVATRGGVHRTTAGEAVYLREKVGGSGALDVNSNGAIQFIAAQRPTASEQHTITVKITDGSATAKTNTVTAVVSVHFAPLPDLPAGNVPSIVYRSLADFTAAANLRLSEIQAESGGRIDSAAVVRCLVAPTQNPGNVVCDSAAPANSAFVVNQAGGAFGWERKPLADIADITTVVPFAATLVARVQTDANGDNVAEAVGLVTLTVDIVDVGLTATPINLTGAPVPSANFIGALQISGVGSGYEFSIPADSGVSRTAAGALRYSGAVDRTNLETAIATIAVSRGESAAVVGALSVTVSLHGCYRTFGESSIGNQSALTGLAGLSAVDLFLHRGADYLAVMSVDGAGVPTFHGDVTAVAGDVLSVVPTDTNVAVTTNFRRLYTAGDGALHIALEEATPSCLPATAALPTDHFYLNDAGARTDAVAQSRLAFSAPVSGGNTLPRRTRVVFIDNTTNSLLVRSDDPDGRNMAGSAANPYSFIRGPRSFQNFGRLAVYDEDDNEVDNCTFFMRQVGGDNAPVSGFIFEADLVHTTALGVITRTFTATGCPGENLVEDLAFHYQIIDPLTVTLLPASGLVPRVKENGDSNLAAGNVVATVLGGGGTGANADDDYTYEVVGTSADLQLNVATGEINFINDVAAVRVSSSFAVYPLTVRVDDGSGASPMVVTVELFVPQPPLLVTLTFPLSGGSGDGTTDSPYTFSGTGNGAAVIVNIAAGDGTAPYAYRKEGVGGVLTVIAGTGANDDTGELMFDQTRIPELGGGHTITVVATDGGNPPKSAIMTIAVAVQFPSVPTLPARATPSAAYYSLLETILSDDAEDSDGSVVVTTHFDAAMLETTTPNPNGYAIDTASFLADGRLIGSQYCPNLELQTYAQDNLVFQNGNFVFVAAGDPILDANDKPTYVCAPGSPLFDLIAPATAGDSYTFRRAPSEDANTSIVPMTPINGLTVVPVGGAMILDEFQRSLGPIPFACYPAPANVNDAPKRCQWFLRRCPLPSTATPADGQQCPAYIHRCPTPDAPKGATFGCPAFVPSNFLDSVPTVVTLRALVRDTTVNGAVTVVNAAATVATTVEFIGVDIRPGAITLTGATVPSANVFGRLRLNTARGSEDGYVISLPSGVSRDAATGDLIFTGALAVGGNLETTVTASLSRGEPAAQVRAIPIPLSLPGCYRDFEKVASLGGSAAVLEFFGIPRVGVHSHNLFLHDNGGYLPAAGANADGVPVFSGGRTLAVGDVISVLPIAAGSDGVADPANFRRVYQASDNAVLQLEFDTTIGNALALIALQREVAAQAGSDDDVLRLAMEEATPNCRRAVEPVMSGRFHLTDDWQPTLSHTDSLLTFSAAVTGGELRAAGLSASPNFLVGGSGAGDRRGAPHTFNLAGNEGAPVANLAVTGGSPLYRFERMGESDGLAVNADGDIVFEIERDAVGYDAAGGEIPLTVTTATPIAPGLHGITVRVSDASGETASAVVFVQVNFSALSAEVDFLIADGSGDGAENSPYTFTFAVDEGDFARVSADGGVRPYRYERVGASDGLTVASDGGIIYDGTRVRSGVHGITVDIFSGGTPPVSVFTTSAGTRHLVVADVTMVVVQVATTTVTQRLTTFLQDGRTNSAIVDVTTTVTVDVMRPVVVDTITVGALSGGIVAASIVAAPPAAGVGSTRVTAFFMTTPLSVRAQPSIVYESLDNFIATINVADDLRLRFADILSTDRSKDIDSVGNLQCSVLAPTTDAPANLCGVGADLAFVADQSSDGTFRWRRKSFTDIPGITGVDAPFIVELAATATDTVGAITEMAAATITLEVVDVEHTELMVTLTGAAPPVPATIGNFSFTAAKEGIVPSSNNADVSIADGKLLYRGAFVRGDTLANEVARITLSRGETGGAEAVRPLIIPVRLRGCYRYFTPAEIDGASFVATFIRRTTHDLFLHRDGAYLPFIGDENNPIFFAGFSSAGAQIRATLVAGDVVSLVPTAEGTDGAGVPGNFYRVYNRSGDLRLAQEDATPPCVRRFGATELPGNTEFFVDDDWVFLGRSNGNSRLTFSSPVSDGAVPPMTLPVRSALPGDGTNADPYLYARIDSNPPAFAFEGLTDDAPVYSIESEQFRAAGTADFVTPADSVFQLAPACGDSDGDTPCAVFAIPTNTEEGVYIIVAAVSLPDGSTARVTVWFSVSELAETPPPMRADVPGRGTPTDPFQFGAGVAPQTFTARNSRDPAVRYRIEGAVFSAGGTAPFTAPASAPFSPNTVCADTADDTPCSFSSSGFNALPAGLYRIPVIIVAADGSEVTVTVHASAPAPSVGAVSDHVIASLPGATLPGAGSLAEPFQVPEGVFKNAVFRIRNTADTTRGSAGAGSEPVIIEEVRHRAPGATAFVLQGAVPGGDGLGHFNATSACRDAVADDTDCTIVNTTAADVLDGVYLIVILITDNDGGATRVSFYIEVVAAVVVEGDVTDFVYATVPDPAGGNGATVTLPYPGDGSADNPYQIVETATSAPRFLFQDSAAFANVGTVTAFVIEKVQYKAATAGAVFADVAKVPVAADSQNRAVFVLINAHCIDNASADTDCSIARNSKQELNVGGVYRIIAVFTANGVSTRVMIHVSVVPAVPAGPFVEAFIPASGEVERAILEGSGSFASPYIIPPTETSRMRFAILNSERRVTLSPSGYTLAMVEYSASGDAADFADDGKVAADPKDRLAFVFTSLCTDGVDVDSNCTIAQNSAAPLKTGGLYRITFVTTDQNNVVTRVHLYAAVVSIAGAGTGSNPFRAAPTGVDRTFTLQRRENEGTFTTNNQRVVLKGFTSSQSLGPAGVGDFVLSDDCGQSSAPACTVKVPNTLKDGSYTLTFILTGGGRAAFNVFIKVNVE